MLKTIYRKHLYFYNLLLVLVLVHLMRYLDWIAWNPNYQGDKGDVILNHIFEFIAFIPVLILLTLSYQWALKRKKKIVLWLLITFFTIFGMVMVLYISTWLELLFVKAKVMPITFNLIVRYSTMGYLIFMLFDTIFYLTYLQIQTSIQRETAHKAETLAKDVQLKMLRYQINPHFLFNVLNTIYTLIDENSSKAKKLVIDMSEYYRYTLNKQDNTVTIEKEVESIMKYLEIQKTRFEEDFEYDLSLDEAAKTIHIPSFLIHLLIENAVKYGTITEKKKLIIRLSVKLTGRNLNIMVSNTGKLFIPASSGEKNSNGTSNGIENLKHRLSLYYDENYSFSLSEETGWVIANVEIKNIIGQ
jgi:sensor histidine kinase YesM